MLLPDQDPSRQRALLPCKPAAHPKYPPARRKPPYSSGTCQTASAKRRDAAFQLVNFIRNTVIEEPIEIPADKLDRRHAVNLLVIGLPEGAEERLPMVD